MNFMKYRHQFFGLSALLVLVSLISLAIHGLRLSVDFVGGSLIEVRLINELSRPISEIEKEVGSVYQLQNIQPLDGSVLQIRGATLTDTTQSAVFEKIQETVGPVELLSLENVGPTLSSELVAKTVTAILLVAGFIMLYVWRQFDDLRFGIAAIIAMFHDSIILIGSFSIFGWLFGAEIDVLFVTALLTTLSFSVHDTIVVFDRVRELRHRFPSASFEKIIDSAIAETISRSLNNSITIIIMLVTLVLLGGDTIRWFAVALLVGSVVGTYSSPCTAAPLLLAAEDIKQRRR